jgi:hypothetical protein
VGRVTRFGEFSPNGRLLTLGRFSKISEVAQDLGLLFSLNIDFVLILTKIVWATFWAIFSQSGHPECGLPLIFSKNFLK